MATCANCVQVAQARLISEAVSHKVLDNLAQSQELCSENWRKCESSERMVQLDLENGISETEFWRGALGPLSKSLENQIELLAKENETLHVVVMRIQSEIKHRAVSSVMPNPREQAVREAVEMEMREELTFLRYEKCKFAKKIFQVNDQLQTLSKIKRAIDEDMQLKCRSISVDRKVTTPNPEYRTSLLDNSKKNKRLKSKEAWQTSCRKLQEDGNKAAEAAASVREECRAMRARLTCAAHSHAERVETALRRRIHYTQNYIEDLRWQLAELDRDVERLLVEQSETEKAVDSCLAQQRRARATLAARATKPDSEYCDDAASRRLHMELPRLKRGIRDLRNNLDNIRSLRNTMAAARGSIECCAQDLQTKLELDVNREKCRETSHGGDASTSTPNISPGKNSTVLNISTGKNSTVLNITGKQSTVLNVIYESEECSPDDSE